MTFNKHPNRRHTHRRHTLGRVLSVYSYLLFLHLVVHADCIQDHDHDDTSLIDLQQVLHQRTQVAMQTKKWGELFGIVQQFPLPREGDALDCYDTHNEDATIQDPFVDVLRSLCRSAKRVDTDERGHSDDDEDFEDGLDEDDEDDFKDWDAPSVDDIVSEVIPRVCSLQRAFAAMECGDGHQFPWSKSPVAESDSDINIAMMFRTFITRGNVQGVARLIRNGYCVVAATVDTPHDEEQHQPEFPMFPPLRFDAPFKPLPPLIEALRPLVVYPRGAEFRFNEAVSWSHLLMGLMQHPGGGGLSIEATNLFKTSMQFRNGHNESATLRDLTDHLANRARASWYSVNVSTNRNIANEATWPMFATLLKNKTCASLMLNHVDPRTRRTPLHIAAEVGHTRVVQALLELGADVYTQDHVGWTPLHLAMRADHNDHTHVATILRQQLVVMGTPDVQTHDVQTLDWSGRSAFDYEHTATTTTNDNGNTNTNTHTHTNTNTDTNTDTNTNTHADTDTNTNTHADTNTNTNTNTDCGGWSLVVLPLPPPLSQANDTNTLHYVGCIHASTDGVKETLFKQKFNQDFVARNRPVVIKGGASLFTSSLSLTLENVLTKYGSMKFNTSSVPYSQAYGTEPMRETTLTQFIDYMSSVSLGQSEFLSTNQAQSDRLSNNQTQSQFRSTNQAQSERLSTDQAQSELNTSSHANPKLEFSWTPRCQQQSNTTKPCYSTVDYILSDLTEHQLEIMAPDMIGVDQVPFTDETNGLISSPPQFYIGPAGSAAPMHFHQDAINYLAYGRKFWFLTPPGGASFDTTPGVVWIEKTLPLLLQDPSARVVVCEQFAGDTVFVPHGWGHAVLNLQASIGFAVNFEQSWNSF